LIIKFLATTFSKQQRTVLKNFLMKKLYTFLCTLVCVGLHTSTSAQATTEYFYTTAGSTYTQDFNGLTQSVTVIDLSASAGTLAYNLSDAPINATGLTGWQVQQVSGSGIPQYGANTGSSSSGRCYSYGAASASNRSLGLLAGSTFRGRIGMIITNSTGGPLTSFRITYTGKQWRGGNTAAQTLAFKYKITVSGNTINQSSYTANTNLDFVTPSVNGTNGALDGNDVANQTAKSFRITGISWPAGQRLAIAWDDPDDSGNDAAFGIDDFIFRADDDVTLPIELTNFTAKTNGTANQLTWTTASEKDNALFTIERSPNGQDFTTIGIVKGNGNSLTEKAYIFSDDYPLSKTYYRLRQTDVNGSETTSKVVSVVRDKGAFARVYPSVTKGDFTLELSNDEAAATIFISNIFGQTVFTQTGLVGTNALSINQLAAGTYFLTVKQASHQTVHKLVKQ
jgi:hypothetical protein